MTAQEIARAVVRVLDAFSCPEIAEADYIDQHTVGIVAADGTRFFLEVQNV